MLFLKQAETPCQSNRDLVERVRAMLDDIEQNRDEAVKRCAADLDRWTKPAFRVPADEIAAARRALSHVFKDRLRLLQEAGHRLREASAGFAAGILGDFRRRHYPRPEDHPGRDCRLLHSGWQVSGHLGRAYERSKRKGRRGAACVIGAAPPRDGEAMYAPTLYALSEAGADEIYTIGRRAGVCVDGLRLRRNEAGGHDHRARQRLCCGG